MIRIDLLPPEYRRAESTAPAIFLGTIGLVLFACSALAGCAYAWFGIVGEARGKVEQAQEQLENMKPRAQYSDRLEVEKKEFSARLDHIKQFSDGRVLWTKKLDKLASIVDSPPEPYQYTIWLDSMQMEMASGRRMGLTMKGSSETAEIRRISNYHSTLQTKPFFDGFEAISNPTAKVAIDEDFSPKESCEFEFKLDLVDSGAKDKKKGAKRR